VKREQNDRLFIDAGFLFFNGKNGDAKFTFTIQPLEVIWNLGFLCHQTGGIRH
jgi:hypothetical protein